jgi:hypothetical protein
VEKKQEKITKLFKDTQRKIALKTQNTIQNLVKQHPRTDKYNKSCIYQMKCLDCPRNYIGQTGRAFHTRYKEYKQAFRNNNSNSEYSDH